MTRSLSLARSPVCRVLLSLAGLLGAAACNSQPPAASTGAPAAKASAATSTGPGTPAAAAVSAAPSGSPLSRLVPPARTSPRALSPLAIEPGVSLGPVSLGETLADLERAGLTVVRDEKMNDFAQVRLPGASPGDTTTLRLSLCEGKIIDIGLGDLRKTTTPVTYAGKPIAPTVAREELARTLGTCGPEDRLEGGNQQPCAGGGVILGYGLGNFLQLSVVPRGFDRYDTCAMATDDGSPVALSDATRTRLLEKMLMDRSISPHWHVDRPGRDPLRIVKTPLVPAVPMTMFGSPVVWIEAADARPGTAFLTITRLDASRTRATLAFTYPIEEVSGSVTFRHPLVGDEWRVEKAEVRVR